MDDTERALVAGICAAPADDMARLVYADYLDEHNRHERAEFIRVQVALATAPVCAWVEEGGPSCESWEKKTGECRAFVWCGACMKARNLRAREKSLFRYAGAPGFFDTIPGAYRNADAARMQITTADQLKYTVRRGFVCELECSAANFLKHADALVWNPKRTILVPSSYEERSEYACEICGNVPDESGCIDHGRGCYTQSEDGGGTSLVDLPERFAPRPCPETAQPITKVVLTFADDSGDELARFLVAHKFTTTLFRSSFAGTSPKWPDVEFELPPRSDLSGIVGGGNPPVPAVEYVVVGDGFLPAEGWLIQPEADEFDTMDMLTGKRSREPGAGERRYSLSLTYPLEDGFASTLPRPGDTFGPVAALTLDRQATITVARAVVESVERLPSRFDVSSAGCVRVRAVVIGDVKPLHPA